MSQSITDPFTADFDNKNNLQQSHHLLHTLIVLYNEFVDPKTIFILSLDSLQVVEMVYG